ncbi:MAG TPA: thrombospondin type-1 domain-containing protein [archaeon]|nr:thrombospondin type-1 domain-containing protein [archaeon]
MGKVRLVAAAFALALILQLSFVLAGEDARPQGLTPEEFRSGLKECKEFEDSVSGPLCSFKGSEFGNPKGIDVGEKNEEFLGKWSMCMKLSILAEDLYAEKKISEEEYNEATGRGEDYDFGILGGFKFSQCFYANCKLIVKYYLDLANAETDPQRKVELYEKAIENYWKCMKTATSELIHSGAFDARLGALGENDDQLNADAADAYTGLCETKIKLIREKIAVETDPQRKMGLYEELQEEILRCFSIGLSGLVDGGSHFYRQFDLSVPYEGDDENTFRNIYIDTMRKKCELRIAEARRKISEAQNDVERAQAETELANAFIECRREAEDSLLIGDYDEFDPFNYTPLSQGELDLINEAIKPRPKDMAGPSADAQAIINLAPERFSDNAGVYTIRRSEIDYANLFGPLPGPDDISPLPPLSVYGKVTFDTGLQSAPSPGAIISIGTGTIDKAFDVATVALRNIPKLPVVPKIDVSAQASDANIGVTCTEDWSCTNWSIWGDWSSCGAEAQLRSRTRKCSDKNACGTILEKPKISETEKKGCGTLDAQVSILVDGAPSAGFVPDKNNQLKVVSAKTLALPIYFSLTAPSELGSVVPANPIMVIGATATGADVVSGTSIAAELASAFVLCAPVSEPKECTADLSEEFKGYISELETSSVKLYINDSIGKTTTLTAAILKGSQCAENWSCGSWGVWSSCSGGTQSRTRACTDANNCTTTASRPALSESQSCSDTAVNSCTENWACGEYGAWGEWGSCSESGSQSQTRTRSCTDANNCATTNNKPQISETQNQSCTYTPTEQKPEYTSHLGTLGSNVADLSYNGGSAQFNTSNTGGQYGYKILNIPAGIKVKICVVVSSGGPMGYNSYPQYHYGYDWSDAAWEAANPGCVTAFNKNAWANGMLLHLGDPSTANASGTVSVTQIPT